MNLFNFINNRGNIMKTSNRILFSGIAALFFGAILILILLSTFGSSTNDALKSFNNNRHHSHNKTIKGEGKIISATQTLPKFNKINSSGNYKITLQSGATPRIDITTDDNLQKYLKVRVNGSELQIEADDELNLSPSRPIEVKITTPELKAIQLSGDTELSAVDINTPELGLSTAGYNHTTLKCQVSQLTLNLSGSSNLDLNLTNNQSLKISSSGDGKIKLAGSTENLILNNAGTINIEALNLTAKNATINGAGATHVNIHATDNITTNTAGKSTLHYTGHPKVINRSLGSMKITKEGE
jgi:hypothetical protein